ncbi:MAG: glutathione S-transferase [Myxococcota bacterium]
MITVHHLEQSRSHRILWFLEELELSYEIEHHKRDAGFRAPKRLRELHPLGRAPIVVDDGEVLAETGAIMEHLLEKHGGGRLEPEPGSDAARHYRYFMHYAEGSLMAPLLVRLIFDRVESAKLPFFAKPIAKKIAQKVNHTFISGEMKLHGGFLNDLLAKRTWITGDTFTAADVMLSFPVQALLARGRLSGEQVKHIEAYVSRATGRPAYARAVERGGGEPIVKT